MLHITSGLIFISSPFWAESIFETTPKVSYAVLTRQKAVVGDNFKNLEMAIVISNLLLIYELIWFTHVWNNQQYVYLKGTLLMSKYTITVCSLLNERSIFICAINRGEECIRQTSLITTQIARLCWRKIYRRFY
jgi:hypothetical protein